MQCLECGAELLDGAKFCSNCGAMVSEWHEPRRAATLTSPVGRRRAMLTLAFAALGVIAIAAVGVLIIKPFGTGSCYGTEQSLTQFIEQVRDYEVEQGEVDGRVICYVVIGDDSVYRTEMESGDTVRQILQDAGIAPEDWPPFKFR